MSTWLRKIWNFCPPRASPPLFSKWYLCRWIRAHSLFMQVKLLQNSTNLLQARHSTYSCLEPSWCRQGMTVAGIDCTQAMEYVCIRSAMRHTWQLSVFSLPILLCQWLLSLGKSSCWNWYYWSELHFVSLLHPSAYTCLCGRTRPALKCSILSPEFRTKMSPIRAWNSGACTSFWAFVMRTKQAPDGLCIL